MSVPWINVGLPLPSTLDENCAYYLDPVGLLRACHLDEVERIETCISWGEPYKVLAKSPGEWATFLRELRQKRADRFEQQQQITEDDLSFLREIGVQP